LRNELLARLATAWEFSREGEPPLGKGVFADAMATPNSTAKFYDVKEVQVFDIFRKDTHEYFKVWLDKESELGRWFGMGPQGPQNLMNFWAPELIYKFVIPQMVAHYRALNPSTAKLSWDLPTWMIGLARFGLTRASSVG
jgi:hypothetical protein